MELIKKEEDGWNFQGIDEAFENDFARFVLDDYMNCDDKIILLPSSYPYGSMAFTEGFHDSYMIFEASIEKAFFPDINWDDLSEDEQEEKSEDITQSAYDYDYLYASDLRKVLDTFQLFYIATEYDLYPGCGGGGQVYYRNSPLQEVW